LHNSHSVYNSIANSREHLAGASDSSKQSFLHLFDSLYDTLADTRSLKTTLEDQIRKSTALLQTLQASGGMIEGLVRGHFREMQRDMVKDVSVLEKRIARLEEKVSGAPSQPLLSPTPPLSDRRNSDNSSTSETSVSSVAAILPNGSANGNGNHYDRESMASDAARFGLHGGKGSGKNGSSPNIRVHSPAENSSQNGGKKDAEYESLLVGLKARLDLLERRMSVS